MPSHAFPQARGRVHIGSQDLVKADSENPWTTVEVAVADAVYLHAGWTHFTCAYEEALPVQQLKESLSRALSLFPTFTGRLVSVKGGGGRYAVACNNAGVGWLAGTSPNTLDALQPPAAADARPWLLPDTSEMAGARLLDALPQMCTDRDWPLARVSVLHLSDGATAITVSMCHVLGDFASMRMLLRHWAAAFSGISCKEAPLPYDRAWVEGLAAQELPHGYTPNLLVRRPRLIQLRFVASAAKHWALRGGGLSGVISFRVSAERIQALKKEATADLAALGPKTGDQWVSSNDALVARLWQALSRLPVRRGASFAPCVVVDARGRTDVPNAAVGNFAFFATPEACDAAGCSLGQLALRIRTAIHGMSAGWAKGLAWSQGRNPQRMWLSPWVPGRNSMISLTGCIPTTNWDVSTADATFGGAAPAAFMPHACPMPHVAVVWAPPQRPSDRVVSIRLTRREGQQLTRMLPGGL